MRCEEGPPGSPIELDELLFAVVVPLAVLVEVCEPAVVPTAPPTLVVEPTVPLPPVPDVAFFASQPANAATSPKATREEVAQRASVIVPMAATALQVVCPVRSLRTPRNYRGMRARE